MLVSGEKPHHREQINCQNSNGTANRAIATETNKKLDTNIQLMTEMKVFMDNANKNNKRNSVLQVLMFIIQVLMFIMMCITTSIFIWEEFL